MSRTLALLHTTAVTVGPLSALAKERLPGVRVVSVLDDSLLADVIAAGEVTPEVERRLRAYVEQMVVTRADAVLSCCSSIGEAIERIATSAPVSVWRIDEAMAEEAAARGRRVAVLATVETTLGPTARLVQRKALEIGRPIDLEATCVPGAYAALASGRAEEHDQRVTAALADAIARCDVVVLAQASMARLLDAMPEPPRVPVLTSPLPGLDRARVRLDAMGASE